MDLKKQFLKIQMADLKRHFENDRSATHALEGLKEIKIWKVWRCWCNFHSTFYSENLMMQDVLNEHLCTSQKFLRGNNSTELESFYKICKLSEKWRPVDVAAAVKIMEDLSRNEQGDQGQYISKVFMNQDEWPYSNDSKREEIINKIQERLREFLNIGWFDSSQISVFMDLIMDMMKNQIPEPLLKEHRTNCTLFWVCFLDISGLNGVFMFLDDLYNICGLQSLCKSHVKDEVRGDPCVVNFEKITFNEDFSWVAFDNRMLRGELFVPNDGFAFRFSADDEIELSDDECKDAIVDWLLSGDTTKELFNICKAEFQRLQNIRAIKSEYLKELEHWKYLEDQLKDIEAFPYLDRRASPFKSFLLERQKEINADTFESDMIFDILSEEQEQDNNIILEIRNQIDEMTEKIYKFDCIIRTTIIAMKQTMKKIAMVTVYDYRSIVVPLLKSYMRARLEDHINAEKKSKKVPGLYCGHNLIDFYQETKRLAELTGAKILRNEAEDVPFSGYYFGTVNWIDFYRAQHVRCDEESSEPEQQKGPKAPESD
ncbi:uncharacterized protein LOC142634743 [Castanea sativa]|uniref:uncharacterized protein LOC142634743 n=1 Tax=Castanea sativa TaxID=21020 RepID=UPI003F652F1A